MDEKTFSMRLSQLRTQKGVTARKMSLDIGQNEGYINNIESKRVFPSMAVFFVICEYLNIKPSEFFSEENQSPAEITAITKNLKKLNRKQLDHIADIIEDLTVIH